MTRPAIFTTTIRFKAARAQDQAFAVQIGAQLARHINDLLVWDMRAKVASWLTVNDRADHFVNAYDNTDDQTGCGLLNIKLSDRTTALLLKLAIDA